MTLVKPAMIILVEDNPADADLVSEALAEAQVECDLRVLSNGKKALEYVNAVDEDEQPCPDLVLLDLNLPLVNGEDILKHIRRSKRCADVKVLVVTSSNAVRDRQMAMKLGATDYFRKPSSLAQYMELGPKVRDLLRSVE